MNLPGGKGATAARVRLCRGTTGARCNREGVPARPLSPLNAFPARAENPFPQESPVPGLSHEDLVEWAQRFEMGLVG
jgi:hypothetical protein